MRHMRRFIFWLFAIVLMAACDQRGQPVEEFGLDKLTKGMSSESDVRMVMGQPHTVWEDKDGTRLLEYPKGPEGARTWIFTIDSFGKLQDYRQVLTPENFARIQRDMSRDEVRRTLGKPRGVAQFARKNEEVWEWRYLDGADIRQFNVHFDLSSGKVTQTSSSRDSLPG
jgi:outer membrane protein assembly factor BamE (lipoprotein component of BamABCDE complex)